MTNLAKCTVQVRLEEATAQLWGGRQFTQLWNFTMQLPRGIVIVHCVVIDNRVASLRSEIVEFNQGPLKESFLVGRIFREMARCGRQVNLLGT